MRILFLQNDLGSPPGLLGAEAHRRGAAMNVIVPHEGLSSDPRLPGNVPDTPDGFDGLIILGGIMSITNRDAYPFIGETERLIRRFADAGKPVLGVCLGAQLIASAYGGSIYGMYEIEWGFVAHQWQEDAQSDPLLAGAPPGLKLMQWHGDTFNLPPGAVHLASSAGVRHEAFRLGAHTYGIQFHIELIVKTARRWARLRAKELKTDAETFARAFEDEITAHYAAHRAFSAQVVNRWLDLVAAAAGSGES